MESYIVRFSNRAAIQSFSEAMELIKQAQEEAPWSDELRRALECLREAWDGLTFREENSP